MTFLPGSHLPLPITSPSLHVHGGSRYIALSVHVQSPLVHMVPLCLQSASFKQSRIIENIEQLFQGARRILSEDSVVELVFIYAIELDLVFEILRVLSD